MQINIELNDDDVTQIKDLIRYVEIRDSLAEGELSIQTLALGLIRKGIETAEYNAATDKMRNDLIKEGLKNIKVENTFKSIAEEKGLYQIQVKELTGINKKTVNEVFNNKGNTRMDIFIKIWLALGCPEFENCIKISTQKD